MAGRGGRRPAQTRAAQPAQTRAAQRGGGRTRHGADALVAGKAHDDVSIIYHAEGVGDKAVEAAHELVVAHLGAPEIVDHTPYLRVAHFCLGCKQRAQGSSQRVTRCAHGPSLCGTRAGGRGGERGGRREEFGGGGRGRRHPAMRRKMRLAYLGCAHESMHCRAAPARVRAAVRTDAPESTLRARGTGSVGRGVGEGTWRSSGDGGRTLRMTRHSCSRHEA